VVDCKRSSRWRLAAPPDSGTPNQGGRGFGRQAVVGIADSWGAVTLGRQNTMFFWSLLDADELIDLCIIHDITRGQLASNMR
jgi:predicted porin